MKYLMNAVQMKEIDRYSIEDIGIPALVLMERAALAAAQLVCEIAGEKDTILAVCGMGNNGADGVAAARILYEWGKKAAVCLAGDEEKASREMKQQLFIARKSGVPIRGKEALNEYTIIIDGIFGIGLSREIGGAYRELVEEINKGEQTVVAVDTPSGVDSTSGKILGCGVRADYTVTFGYGKTGLYLYPGREYAGEIVVKDIGFPARAEGHTGFHCFYYEKEDIKRLPERRADSNKGTYGKLLIAGGARGMGGACVMAARAALRCGAGLVRIAACEENRTMMQASLPEAVFTPWEDIQEALDWADGVVLGPGLSTGEEAVRVFLTVWERQDKPLVLDADGLNLLGKAGGFRDSKRGNVIFTPHLKEMERLSGWKIEKLRKDILAAAKEFGRKDAILVLKDARSVISDGEQSCLNLSGNHALAKGGSGDVLSGIIGSFMVQGADLFSAASLGAYVHGLAADSYIETKSAASLLAGELTEELKWILP